VRRRAAPPAGCGKQEARFWKASHDPRGGTLLALALGDLVFLLGGALCARYLRREVAANIDPKIQHIQLQLDNIQAELNLAITTRHHTRS
jgi:hypothetical protein